MRIIKLCGVYKVDITVFPILCLRPPDVLSLHGHALFSNTVSIFTTHLHPTGALIFISLDVNSKHTLKSLVLKFIALGGSVGMRGTRVREILESADESDCGFIGDSHSHLGEYRIETSYKTSPNVFCPLSEVCVRACVFCIFCVYFCVFFCVFVLCVCVCVCLCFLCIVFLLYAFYCVVLCVFYCVCVKIFLYSKLREISQTARTLLSSSYSN